MVTILKCACGRVDSLRNRVQGLQSPETAYNTQESHQHPRDMADLHSTAPRLTPQRKNKVKVALMIRQRKVNLASTLVMTQKPTTTQEVKSPLVAWRSIVDPEWNCQPLWEFGHCHKAAQNIPLPELVEENSEGQAVQWQSRGQHQQKQGHGQGPDTLRFCGGVEYPGSLHFYKYWGEIFVCLFIKDRVLSLRSTSYLFPVEILV